MQNVQRTIIAALLAGLLLGAAGLAGAGTAGASGDGAYSVRQAHRAVHLAERAAARAQARLREARYVERATRAASDRYGHDVGRWVWLARSEGFPRSSISDVALLMFTESRGDPAAQNSALFSGLFQFGLDWWYGKWNPLVPRVSMHHAKKAWSDNGGHFYPDWDYPNL